MQSSSSTFRQHARMAMPKTRSNSAPAMSAHRSRQSNADCCIGITKASEVIEMLDHADVEQMLGVECVLDLVPGGDRVCAVMLDDLIARQHVLAVEIAASAHFVAEVR